MKKVYFCGMKEEELQILKRFFPAAAVPMVVEAYENARFHLRFKRPRTTKLGDYCGPRNANGISRITLNIDLNPYQMLVTFVHELAHYTVHVNYPGKRLEPHGDEWKRTFAQLLLPYMKPEIFPEDILLTLRRHLQHIKASSSTDQELARVLKRYDTQASDDEHRTVEDLPEGTVFRLKNGMTLQKGPLRRTRYECKSLDNGRTYSVSGLAEAFPP